MEQNKGPTMNAESPNNPDNNPEPELSYEEEQLQQLLILESEKQKIQMDRELREAQEREYQESLKEDLKKNLEFDEPSKEEMRATRLKRFEKG
jgi:hypothetical protein